MKEETNPTAGEQSNTQVNAEEQSNTFNPEQFKSVAEQNGFKVFSKEEYETYTANVRNEGVKNSFNESFGKGLDKAKKMFSEKFGVTLDEGDKFEDALSKYTPSKEQSEDLKILQDKLQEQENSYKSQINELENSYRTRDMLSAFDKAFAELKANVALAPEHLPMWENTLKAQFQSNYSFDGEIVRNGDNELKNDLRNPLSLDEVAKQFLTSSLPQKKDVKAGLGLSVDGGNSLGNVKTLADFDKATANLSIEEKTKAFERFKASQG
jgi:hypothetical protein